jgi:hypothetical protein
MLLDGVMIDVVELVRRGRRVCLVSQPQLLILAEREPSVARRLNELVGELG